MTDSMTPFNGDDGDALEVRNLLRSAFGADGVSDEDVTRLRTRVSHQVRAQAHPHRSMWAAAAAVLVGLLGIGALAPTSGPLPVAGTDTNGPRFQRTQDGAVMIRFAGDRETHRVQISSAPISSRSDATSAAPAKVAHGQLFVDRTPATQSGSITFYRVD